MAISAARASSVWKVEGSTTCKIQNLKGKYLLMNRIRVCRETNLTNPLHELAPSLNATFNLKGVVGNLGFALDVDVNADILLLSPFVRIHADDTGEIQAFDEPFVTPHMPVESFEVISLGLYSLQRKFSSKAPFNS